jgi:nucleoside-diphosphate-sugar epimerase
MKTALVTGSAGFIGRHFTEHLVTKGWDVDLVDIANPWPRNTDCRRYFAESEKRYDLVIHAAAVVGGRAQIDGNPLAVCENFAIDVAAAQWAVRTRPAHFVYFSSSAAYPVWLQRGRSKDDAYLTPRKLAESDIDLDLPELPDAMYGHAKINGERLCRLMTAEGVRCHIFRPFSGYAGDQDTSYPFGAFVARAKRQDRPFELWGDGTATRDWVHVDDIVHAAMVAAENNLPGPYNLCTGVGTTFNQLADMVTAAARYKPFIDRKLDAPVGVQYRVGDPEQLNTFYKPEITLHDGIRRALDTELAGR